MYDRHTRMLGFHDNKVALSSTERKEMRDRRDTNRTRLKSGLVRDEEPAPVGCHTQGSYAMRTMVQHAEKDYDVDDGVYFNKSDLVGPKGGDKMPADAKEMVRKAVHSDKFKKSPEVRTNCVRVFYDQGYHVDIPVYRRTKNDDSTYNYELAGSVWKASDPLAVTKWFRKENKNQSPDLINSGQLCRITKLMKAFARSRESWRSQIATGFMMSKLVTEEYWSNATREDTSLRDTMRAIRNRLNWNLEVDHPVLDEKLTKGADDSRSRVLREKLDWALEQLAVLDNWDCTEKQANKAWDTVFNTTYFTDSAALNAEAVTSAAILQSGSLVDAAAAAVDRQGGGRYG
jgi:hypothetical protein